MVHDSLCYLSSCRQHRMSGTVNALAGILQVQVWDGSRVVDANWPGLDRHTSSFFATSLSGIWDVRLGQAIIGPRESRFDREKLHLPNIGRHLFLSLPFGVTKELLLCSRVDFRFQGHRLGLPSGGSGAGLGIYNAELDAPCGHKSTF